jgi:hypothetical protein
MFQAGDSGKSLRTAFLLTACLGPGGVQSQVVNPADAQRPEGKQEKGDATPGSTGQGAPAERLHTWELPAIQVVGEGPSELREEDRVGKYAQPRWTALRRFPGTRVYVVPEGKAEFEYWLRPTINREGPADIRSLWELELGLPHRLQLDFYLRTDQEGDHSEMLLGQQVEVRYALADWGVIPGNPTLYFEWVGLEKRPDKFEPKLLLGGEIAPRWHWGANLVGEFELGGERENEYQLTGGLSYSVIDMFLAVGVESIVALVDVKEDRGDFDESFLLGPSVQIRPSERFTANLAPLFGIGGHSPEAQIFVNVGWEF